MIAPLEAHRLFYSILVNTRVEGSMGRTVRVYHGFRPEFNVLEEFIPVLRGVKTEAEMRGSMLIYLLDRERRDPESTVRPTVLRLVETRLKPRPEPTSRGPSHTGHTV